MRKKDEKLEKPKSPDSDQFHSRSANYKAEKEAHVDKSYKNKKLH
jgi:hypothetical protein